MSDQAQAVVMSNLHTLRDYVRYAMSQFSRHQIFLGHGTDNNWDEAVQLVLAAVNLAWDVNPAVLDARLLPEEKQRILTFIQQRVEDRKPLPYITQQAWFCDLPFYVDERVLIPRSPIAELIQQQFSPWLAEGSVARILDMCTGSGCIGIACAYAFADAEVDLVDISEDALDVAAININKHQLTERVTAVQSDLFQQLKGQRFDLIVSNPPYVDAVDLANMPAEFAHEPELALGSGVDGLEITRQILRQANDYLSDDGLLVVEVGNSEVHLMQQYPQLPVVWLEFERGGNGVFAITAVDLAKHRLSI
ncbi:50S ribosomal protein L3 N(5)-glutamine methyltransferase [Pontibacter sp. JAM-7]|uniref:50S ribosomal protein L3 N(5)-glutamine methyltransferase n=1 Tax=Pontibacter sp. JAM-7 TaxID=3366581 RepID=UPI003AF8516F